MIFMVESVIVKEINGLFESGYCIRTENRNHILPTNVIRYKGAKKVSQYINQIVGDLGYNVQSVSFRPYSEFDGTKSLEHYSEPGWRLVIDEMGKSNACGVVEIHRRIKEEFKKYGFSVIEYSTFQDAGFFMVHKNERTTFLNEN